MARRVFVTGAAPLLCAVFALAVGGSAAQAAAGAAPIPPGPRLAVGVLRVGTEVSTELLTIGPAGEEPETVARGTGFPGSPDFEHPIWSTDGTELAFYGPGHETSAVYVGGADGSRPRLLAGFEHPGGRAGSTLPEPLFDPKTGALIVAVVHTPHGEGPFGDAPPTGPAGAIRREFWSLPVDGAKPRRLSSRPVTGKHALILYPYSVAPSGRVAATGLGRRGFSVVIADPHSGATRTVVPTTKQREGSLEPAISPDGKEIVYKVDKDLEWEADAARTGEGRGAMAVLGPIGVAHCFHDRERLDGDQRRRQLPDQDLIPRQERFGTRRRLAAGSRTGCRADQLLKITEATRGRGR